MVVVRWLGEGGGGWGRLGEGRGGWGRGEVVGGGGRSKGEGGFESMVLVGITSIISV